MDIIKNKDAVIKKIVDLCSLKRSSENELFLNLCYNGCVMKNGN